MRDGVGVVGVEAEPVAWDSSRGRERRGTGEASEVRGPRQDQARCRHSGKARRRQEQRWKATGGGGGGGGGGGVVGRGASGYL